MVLFLIYLIQSCKSGLRMKRKCAISSTGSSGSSVRRGENSLPNYRMQRTRQGAPTVLLDHRTRIADHAARRRLPAVFGVSEYAEAGGLLAYGPSLVDGYRRAAIYVDRIPSARTISASLWMRRRSTMSSRTCDGHDATESLILTTQTPRRNPPANKRLQ